MFPKVIRKYVMKQLTIVFPGHPVIPPEEVFQVCL